MEPVFLSRSHYLAGFESIWGLLASGLLQFVHPKCRGSRFVVDQGVVLHPDAELVATFQRDHVSLRGGAEVGHRRTSVGQAAERLHHSLLRLVRLVLP